MIPSLNRLTREEQNESRALSRGPMTLIVLAMTGLLACAFHVTSYVNGCGTREARGQLVPQLMDQATGRRRTNARTSWVPGRMPKDTTALT